jgi:adenine-specific DNA-methyltransferase
MRSGSPTVDFRGPSCLMSRLTELLAQLAESNPDLANDLRRETDVLGRRRPFGLNFERHIPETVQLPNRRVRRGDKVVFRAPRGESEKDLDPRTWIVTGFEDAGSGRQATLILPEPSEEPVITTRKVVDLVVVAEFRDPIYPGLRPGGTVESDAERPYHVVINGENYHVLEALTFTCGGAVDCIYIDPPYNSRDKQWKYNNDFVDSDDDYRHSKWLAMMERRLKVAKDLLNPDDSALIVTIDEREVLRLGLLLEQTFPEARIQMVTSVISAKGAVRRGQFSRVEEHLFFVLFGDARVRPWIQNMLSGTDDAEADAEEESDDETASDDDDVAEEAVEWIEWLGLRRREPSSIRGSRPNQFFPIFVDAETGHIRSIGDAVADDVDRLSVPVPDGTVALWPLRPDGTERLWGLTPEALRKNWADGFVRVNWKANKKTGTVYYLPSGTIASIRAGEVTITGRRPDDSVEGFYAPDTDATTPPKRVWNMRSHNAETGGTNMLTRLIPGRRFEYPKSLYAVEDTLRFIVGHKPHALVLDFFAGSGTTAHAVMRLNKQDGGHRRSIMVTNNEVSAAEADALAEKGFRPGDAEWEALGICEFLTKPRVRAAITGEAPEGQAVKGSYRFTDEFPLSDGFAENAAFFDLTYEDPERVRFGIGFEAVAPLFWLRAGAEGERISDPAATFQVADTYAILFNVDSSFAFVSAVRVADDVRIAYIVTDDETQFQVVAAQLPGRVEPVRLYATYLDNFRIVPRD